LPQIEEFHVPRGSNLPAVAGFNQAVILDEIRRSVDGMSQVELSNSTGLSAQTVSRVSRRLLQQGLIREAGKLIDGPGKPRTILQLEPRGGYAIGVHMDPAIITCVLLDLEGNIVAHSRMRSPLSGEAHETVETIALAVRALISTSHAPEERIIGLGIAAPGPIDAERGAILQPPLVPNWSDFPVREELSSATGFPALIAKDATASAVAERWKNAADPSRDFAFVYYGTGVGLGMVLDNELFLGSSSNVGDIGHIMVSRDGPVCPCGRRGCFGETVRPFRMVEEALELGILARPADHLDFDMVDDLFNRLLAAADHRDPIALRILDEAIKATAVFLVSMFNLLDVDRIVFGGPYWSRVEKRFFAQLPAEIAALNMNALPHPVDLSGTVVGEDVAAVGAACLVLDGTFSPRSSQLFIAQKAIPSLAR
jgi:predicted NBD/HSP70 family sugar kinase